MCALLNNTNLACEMTSRWIDKPSCIPALYSAEAHVYESQLRSRNVRPVVMVVVVVVM